MPDPASLTAFSNASDAYSPKQIAERIHAVGVTKAGAPAFQLLLLALLAGAFISLGAAFFTVVVTDSAFGYGATRLLGSRSVSDKILAVIFPVSAFVACGFEHSVANMVLIPVGLLAAGSGAGSNAAALAANLRPVTLGDIVGGGVLVAMVYWAAYLRPLK